MKFATHSLFKTFLFGLLLTINCVRITQDHTLKASPELRKTSDTLLQNNSTVPNSNNSNPSGSNNTKSNNSNSQNSITHHHHTKYDKNGTRKVAALRVNTDVNNGTQNKSNKRGGQKNKTHKQKNKTLSLRKNTTHHNDTHATNTSHKPNSSSHNNASHTGNSSHHGQESHNNSHQNNNSHPAKESHHDNNTHNNSHPAKASHHDNNTHNNSHPAKESHHDNNTHNNSHPAKASHHDNNTHNNSHQSNGSHHGNNSQHKNGSHQGNNSHHGNGSHHGNNSHQQNNSHNNGSEHNQSNHEFWSNGTNNNQHISTSFEPTFAVASFTPPKSNVNPSVVADEKPYYSPSSWNNYGGDSFLAAKRKAEKTNEAIGSSGQGKTYYTPFSKRKDGKAEENFESVTYTKQLSPAGKRELELRESGEKEYLKIINAGYETPKMISNVINNYQTGVTQKFDVDYNYKPYDANDKRIWQNPEQAKYGNTLYDTYKFETPAKFVIHEGEVVVHAPSNSDLRITKSVPTFGTSSGFLELTEDI